MAAVSTDDLYHRYQVLVPLDARCWHRVVHKRHPIILSWFDWNNVEQDRKQSIHPSSFSKCLSDLLLICIYYRRPRLPTAPTGSVERNKIGELYWTMRATDKVLLFHTQLGFPWTQPGLGNVVLHEGCKKTLVTTSVWFWRHSWHPDIIFTSVSAKCFDVNLWERSRTELFLIEKCSYFSVKLIKQHIFKSKCKYRRKSMQEKESIMVLRCKLKILSPG